MSIMPPLSFDSATRIHESALLLRGQRAELLANNLSNGETPGFKARDINFNEAMRQAMGDMTSADMTSQDVVTGPRVVGQSVAAGMAQTNSRHLGGATTGTAATFVQYRQVAQPSLDGNTVDGEKEKAAFAQNSLEFNASFTLLNQQLRGISSALRGD